MARRTANSARLRGLLIGAALTACLGIRSARADAQADTERAQQLFDEARSLMKEGNYALACPKLAQSQELDPGGGTLLNLGICHAGEGRTATALKELNLALALAKSEGRADRERTAQKHLDDLLPELCQLTLLLRPGASVQGLSIQLDGSPIDAALLGSPIPVDPGPHQIRASKPGYKPWAMQITIARARDQHSLEIPILESETSSAAPPPAPAPPVGGLSPTAPSAPPAQQPSTNKSRPRWPGLATLGVGVAAVGVGSYFGIHALVLKSDSNHNFNGTSCTQQSCADDWSAAKKAALYSDISFAVGLAALSIGAYLEFAPAKRAQAAQGLTLQLTGTRSGAALAARTEF